MGLPRLTRGNAFYETVDGLRHIYGQVDIQTPATALDWSDLQELQKGIDFGCLADVRFWCATILGFQGLFRASEIGRVQLDHIEINSWGVRVTVLFSKTNHSPVPVTMVARGDVFCPVLAFLLLMKLMRAAGEHAPFPSSYHAFNKSLQARCSDAGISKLGVSTHSLRRGGTTALALAGVPEAIIQAHGRWSSLEYRKYICYLDSALQRRPTAMLLESQRAA